MASTTVRAKTLKGQKYIFITLIPHRSIIGIGFIVERLNDNYQISINGRIGALKPETNSNRRKRIKEHYENT